MTSTWRLVKRRYAPGAFDGDGARRYGGRWNSPGVRAVYTSGSLALATLELLVHLKTTTPLAGYVVIEVRIDDDLIETLRDGMLPGTWRESPPGAGVQSVGDHWLREGKTPALKVRSVVIDREFNFVLNPAHPKFRQLRIGQPEPFRLDPRLP